MDYRAAARYRATRLTDLISEQMLATDEGLIKSTGKALSAKTKAKFKGIQQTFDPLNIASALLGRSRLGTTIVGKMFGRSAEDISYFSGDRGKRAQPIRKFRYRNPLLTSVGSGDTSPNKRNDSLANVFGKIYNLLKLEKVEDIQQKETEENFRKEREDEDERRHKELIKAIKMMKQGTKVPDKKDDENDVSIFGKFLKIAKGVFDFVGKILGTIFDIIVGLGKIIFKIVEKIASIAFDIIKFVAEGVGKIVAEVFGLIWSGIKKLFGMTLEKFFLRILEKLAGCGCIDIPETGKPIPEEKPAPDKSKKPKEKKPMKPKFPRLPVGGIVLPSLIGIGSELREKQIEEIENKARKAAEEGNVDELKNQLRNLRSTTTAINVGPDFESSKWVEDNILKYLKNAADKGSSKAKNALSKMPQSKNIKSDTKDYVLSPTTKMTSIESEIGKTTLFSTPSAFEISNKINENKNLQMEAKRKRSGGAVSNQTNNIVVPSEKKPIFSSGPAAIHDMDLNDAIPYMNYGRPRY